jgi:hypothetical protein
MALVWVCSASRSAHAFPRVRLAVVSPSFHVTMAPSLLFNSSRTRSSLCSSSTTTNVTIVPGGGEGLHTHPTSEDHHRAKKQAQTTASIGRSPTSSLMRPSRGWPLSSSGEAVVIDRYSLGPRSKGAYHGPHP